MRRVLSAILAVSVCWSTMPCPCGWSADETEPELGALLERHPDASVYRLTLDEYRQAEPLLRECELRGRLIIAQVARPPENDTVRGPTTATPLPAPAVATNAVTNAVIVVTNGVPPAETNRGPVYAPETIERETSCNAFFDLIGDLGQSDSDAAIVIFIVIGLTVVVAVVVYSAAFLYQALMGTGDHSYWWETELQTAFVLGGDDGGYLVGLRVGSGVQDRHARMGLIVEGGYLDADVRTDDQPERIEVSSPFALAGAGVRWPVGGPHGNASFLGVELLAGTAWDNDVDLMSTARATLSFGLGPRARLGLSFGALYLGLSPEDSPLKDVDNFNTLIGIESGFRF